MKEKYYNISVQEYVANCEASIDSSTNGWTAQNLGDSIVWVNNIPLLPNTVAGQPGMSVSIGGNEGEIYTGRMPIRFNPGGVNPRVVIIFKVYSDPALK